MGERSTKVLFHGEIETEDERIVGPIRRTIWRDGEALHVLEEVQLARPIEFIPISVHLVPTRDSGAEPVDD